MSTYHVKSTGTRTSGASTADDWSDANCYATFYAAMTEAGVSDDTIIINDETITETQASAAATWIGTKIIRSRSGDPELCTLSINHATEELLGIYPGAGSPDITISGIRFTSSQTRTGVAAANALVGVSSGTITQLTFEDCIFGPLTVNLSSNSVTGSVFHHVGDIVRDVNLTNCRFEDITATYSGYGVLMVLAGTGPTFKFSGCTFADWTLTYGSQAVGDILGNGNVAGYEFTDDCVFRDITRNSPQRSLFRAQGTGPSFKMIDTSFYRITSNHTTGQVVEAPLVNILGPFHCERLYFEDINVVVPETNGGGDGCTLFQSGSAAVGKFRNIVCRRCSGRTGAAIYCSDGASLDAQGIQAYECNVAHGVIYVGYNGDMDLSGVLIQDCQYYALTGANRHAGGLAIYFRNNPAAGARDSSCNISNVTLIDNDNDALSEGIEIQNEHATASVTAVINNAIVRNNGTLEIKYVKTGGAGNLTVTTNSCNVLNGLTAITTDDGTNTSVTNNDLTSTDPALDSDNKLPVGSSFSGAGVSWWSGITPIDADGEPLPTLDLDVGGLQGSDSTSHPFHPLNL